MKQSYHKKCSDNNQIPLRSLYNSPAIPYFLGVFVRRGLQFTVHKRRKRLLSQYLSDIRIEGWSDFWKFSQFSAVQLLFWCPDAPLLFHAKTITAATSPGFSCTSFRGQQNISTLNPPRNIWIPHRLPPRRHLHRIGHCHREKLPTEKVRWDVLFYP